VNGRIIGIGPPPREKVEYTQLDYYCEQCDTNFADETIYNTYEGKYVCEKCEKEIQKEIKKHGRKHM
jgi:hypothetical protein|tara:strand:+ start:1123 stop:1323 length:201 start_codon:yes stop_codon:yes gene_type:complete